MNNQYKIISDPGHAWLEVPILELGLYGVSNKISQFSYVSFSKGMAYLEEDVDMDIFVQARFAQFPNKDELRTEFYNTVEREYQENTPIRNYSHWR